MFSSARQVNKRPLYACRTEHRRAVLRKGTLVYVPYETDETGSALSGASLGLAGNQLLKRGGYLLMGHMTGPDPLFRLYWSVEGTIGRSKRQTGVLQYWIVGQPGQRKIRQLRGDLFWCRCQYPRPSEAGLADFSRYVPNIFTSPSEASRKEAVSTPSLVTGTSANDCIHKAIGKRNGE